MDEKMPVRKMTFTEYDAYLDYMEELKDKAEKKEISMRKMGFNLAKWVLEKIYGMDLSKIEYSNDLWKLFEETVALTEERELADEKNSEASGIGELKVE